MGNIFYENVGEDEEGAPGAAETTPKTNLQVRCMCVNQ